MPKCRESRRKRCWRQHLTLSYESAVQRVMGAPKLLARLTWKVVHAAVQVTNFSEQGLLCRIRGRFERIIRDAQNRIVAAVEEEDGEGTFREDAWARPGGGGGVSRVMQVPIISSHLQQSSSAIITRAMGFTCPLEMPLIFW